MNERPEVRKRFRKDPEFEEHLANFNEILAPHEEAEYVQRTEEFSTLHVVGVPRSGTTLLAQLMASHLDIGCINNLIAAFWRAPVYGVRLSRKLLSERLASSLGSEYGRTNAIQEPHEFNYFWFKHLKYPEYAQQPEGFDEQIDWEQLKLVLLNITHAYECPVLFKSFLLGFHMARLQRELSKTCFVRIRRDPVDTAMSLLRFREDFLGSMDHWWSLKPLQYATLKDEPYWVQVAGQVFFLEQAMDREVEKLCDENIVDVTYDELCRDPRRVLEEVQQRLKAHGQNVEILGDVPASLPLSSGSGDAELRMRVAQAVEGFAKSQIDELPVSNDDALNSAQ